MQIEEEEIEQEPEEDLRNELLEANLRPKKKSDRIRKKHSLTKS